MLEPRGSERELVPQRSLDGHVLLPIYLFLSCLAILSCPALAKKAHHSWSFASRISAQRTQMETRRPPEYILEVLSDPFSLKDIVKALLHTIFFHRYFTPIRPLTRDLLDITLPTIDDVDLETLIDQRATSLVRQMDSQAGYSYGGGILGGYNGDGGTRGQLAVRFFEKKRRKTYFSFGKGEDDVCWEQWTLNISLTRAKDEMGELLHAFSLLICFPVVEVFGTARLMADM